MLTNSTEIKYFQNDVETINEIEQKIINEIELDNLESIELDNLESIVTIEFADGLPCDTVVNGF